MSSRSRLAVAVAAWAGAVLAATVVGLTAVGAIGTGIVGSGPAPLSAAEVEERLAAASATPVPAPGPATVAGPAPGVVGSVGGTAVVDCSGGAPRIVSVTPAQGFREHGEPEGNRVRFESEDLEVRMFVSCRGGRPERTVEVETES